MSYSVTDKITLGNCEQVLMFVDSSYEPAVVYLLEAPFSEEIKSAFAYMMDCTGGLMANWMLKGVVEAENRVAATEEAANFVNNYRGLTMEQCMALHDHRHEKIQALQASSLINSRSKRTFLLIVYTN